jgi:hypothetical protein
VNDAPSFTKGATAITVTEGSGSYSAPWASNISAGPAEIDQTVSFKLACDNAALFKLQRQLSSAGLLTFTVAASKSGNSTCNVTLTDSEGATSAAEQLTVTVTPGGRLSNAHCMHDDSLMTH